jgi:hypothetical protein
MPSATEKMTGVRLLRLSMARHVKLGGKSNDGSTTTDQHYGSKLPDLRAVAPPCMTVRPFKCAHCGDCRLTFSSWMVKPLPSLTLPLYCHATRSPTSDKASKGPMKQSC